VHMYVDVQTLHCLAAAYCGSSSQDVIAAEQVCFACDTLKPQIVLDNSTLTCCLRDGCKCMELQIGSAFVNSSVHRRENQKKCGISDNVCVFGPHDSAGNFAIHTRIY